VKVGDTNPHSVDRPRPEVLDEDVGLGREFVHNRDCFGLIQIEADASLASIARHEHGRDVALAKASGPGDITKAWWLDLDHIGALIGKYLSAEWA
jgi:hypothetical protein